MDLALKVSRSALNKLIIGYDHKLELDTSLESLGEYVSKDERPHRFRICKDKKGQQSIRVVKPVGRPRKGQLRCRFCKLHVRDQNRLYEHWGKTHLKEEGNQRFLVRLKQYRCPVKGCSHSRSALKRKHLAQHLKSNYHRPSDLLEHGIECWLRSDLTADDIADTIIYLGRMSFLRESVLSTCGDDGR